MTVSILSACQTEKDPVDSIETGTIPVSITETSSTPTDAPVAPTDAPVKPDEPAEVPTELTVLTDEEAREILSDLLPRAAFMHGSTFNGSQLNMDYEQSMPGNEDYKLVVGGDYHSFADLQADIESIFTKDLAEIVFYSRYMDMERADSLYKEYEGQLYQYVNNYGRGWATNWFPETAVVQSQEGNLVVIEVEQTLFDEPYEALRVVMENVDGQWRIAERLD